jgi:hypothetical protein
MTKPVKGFDALYSDPDPPEKGSMPLPGTDAYLAWVAEKKRKKKGTGQGTATDPNSGSDITAISDIPRQSDTRKRSDTSRISDLAVESDIDRGSVVASHLTVIENYTKLHNSVWSILTELKEAELRIYLYLLEKTHGRTPERNFLEYRQRDVMADLQTKAHSTVSLGLKRLERRGLVQWLRKSGGKGERSILVVRLPCELTGKGSKDIEFHEEIS